MRFFANLLPKRAGSGPSPVSTGLPQSELKSVKELEPPISGKVLTVLVEEEERVRRYWREFFDANGLGLEVFAEPEGFLAALPRLEQSRARTRFYFDRDFGVNRRGVGTELAALTRSAIPDAQIALVTAYWPEDFKDEFQAGILNAVYPKYPEPIFGPNYFNARFRLEMQEVGAEKLVPEMLSRLAEGLEPLRIFDERHEPQNTQEYEEME
jgi:hypothetical protein